MYRFSTKGEPGLFLTPLLTLWDGGHLTVV